MMKHLVVIALALAGLMAMTHTALAFPLAAVATPHVDHRAGPLTKRYSALWHACDDKASCNPGRNIRRSGIETRGGTRPAHRVDYRATVATLDRWLHPPAVSVPTARIQQTTPIAAPTITAGPTGGMPDCTWRPESGGSYTASNPSGAYGKYQIMPVHYGAGGVCAGMGKSPGEQEVCARRVFASSGAGAWVNC